MKTTMKFFAAIAIMMGFTMGAMAQTGNANIEGKATVLQEIKVTGITALNFGNVSPGIPKTINLVNVATGSQLGGETATTGVFTVSAAAGSNVDIEFTTLPGFLARTDNANVQLPIDLNTAGYSLVNPYVAGLSFDPTSGPKNVWAGVFPTNSISSENLIYVFIGGTVTPPSNQPMGDYTGNITLTATYN